MPINITPQQWLDQWVMFPRRFHLGTWNFEVEAGKTAVDVFKKSFSLKKFNSQFSYSWPSWSADYTKWLATHGGYHGMMDDTGSLQNSIKWKLLGNGIGNSKGVQIYTDPSAFGNTSRHKGFCYAAVHNSEKGNTTFRTNSRAQRIGQRQFMGHSSVLNNELRKLENIHLKIYPF